jgi:energy-coupling factor transporter ATP-binding protein EcfA2
MTWKKSVGKISLCDIDNQKNAKNWATAFFVGGKNILTAYHFFNDLNKVIESFGDKFNVKFVLTFEFNDSLADQIYNVNVEPIYVNEICDFAFFSLQEEVLSEVYPLKINNKFKADNNKRFLFECFGYPETINDGLNFNGIISGDKSHQKTSLIQMYSQEATENMVIKGLSGAPVIVDERVVGIVQAYVQNDEGKTVGNLLFASSISNWPEDAFKYFTFNPCIHLPPLKDLSVPEDPFVDLQPYTKKHAYVFFGRCYEIGKILQAINGPQKFILIYGQSGVGKSSILNAGVIPRLDREEWSIKTILPYKDLELQSIQEEIKKINKKSLIIFDQLEEIYINNYSKDFLDKLKKEFSESQSNECIILSFRKEWIAEFERDLGELNIDCSFVFIQPMSPNSIREVINEVKSQPNWSLTIDDDATSRIVNALISDVESSVAPILQIFLTKLWKDVKFNNPRHIDSFLVDKNLKEGTALRDILNTRLKAINEKYPTAADGLVLDILNYYVTEIRTSKVVSINEIKKAYSHIEQKIILDIIEEMISHSLITKIARIPIIKSNLKQLKEEAKTKLSHDALAPVISEKISESSLLGQKAWRILTNYSRNIDLNESLFFLDRETLNLINSGRSQMRGISQEQEELINRSHNKIRRQQFRKSIFYILILVTLSAFGFLTKKLTNEVSSKNQKINEKEISINEKERVLDVINNNNLNRKGLEHLSNAQDSLQHGDTASAVLELASSLENFQPNSVLKPVAMAMLINILPETPRFVDNIGKVYGVDVNKFKIIMAQLSSGKYVTWSMEDRKIIPSPDIAIDSQAASLHFLSPHSNLAVVVYIDYDYTKIFAWEVGSRKYILEKLIKEPFREVFWVGNSTLKVMTLTKEYCFDLLDINKKINNKLCKNHYKELLPLLQRHRTPKLENQPEALQLNRNNYATVYENGDVVSMPPMIFGNWIEEIRSLGSVSTNRLEVKVDELTFKAIEKEGLVKIIQKNKKGDVLIRCEDYNQFIQFDKRGNFFLVSNPFSIWLIDKKECRRIYNLEEYNVDSVTKSFVALLFNKAKIIKFNPKNNSMEFILEDDVVIRLKPNKYNKLLFQKKISDIYVMLRLPRLKNGAVFSDISPDGGFVSVISNTDIYFDVWDIRHERPYLVWSPNGLLLEETHLRQPDYDSNYGDFFNIKNGQFVFNMKTPLPAIYTHKGFNQNEWKWATRENISLIIGFDIKDGTLKHVTCENFLKFKEQLNEDQDDNAAIHVIDIIKSKKAYCSNPMQQKKPYHQLVR